MDSGFDEDARTLLRPEVLARRLGVTPRTLEDWRRRGVGPPWLRITQRVIRYERTAVEEWLTQQRPTGGPPQVVAP